MAVPTNATRFRMAPLKAGVMLGVSPSSDPTFDMEIARATSSGVYTTLTRLTGKGTGVPVVYTDILPVDNKTRSYKARAVKDGWDAGNYTSIVTAKPIELPEIVPNVTPITGQKIGANVYLSTGQTLSFGTPANASNYLKQLRVPATIFQPITSAVGYSYGVGTLTPTTTAPSTAGRYVGTVPIPTGATVYKVQWIYSRTSANAVFRGEFYSATTAGVATLQYGKTSTSVSANTQVLSSSSFSFTVASNYVVSRVAMKSTSAGGNRASLVSMNVFYRAPTIQTGF